MDSEVGEIDLRHAVTFAEKAYNPLLMEGNDSDDIQIHRRAQRAPALMVGMITADLRSPGCGKDMDVIAVRKISQNRSIALI